MAKQLYRLESSHGNFLVRIIDERAPRPAFSPADTVTEVWLELMDPSFRTAGAVPFAVDRDAEGNLTRGGKPVRLVPEIKSKPKALKPFIVRYSGGMTMRIDAPSKAAALEKAKANPPDLGWPNKPGEPQEPRWAKVVKIVPMTDDWQIKIRGRNGMA